MTGLLVSVRDAAEAQAALRGGADLIDVKEPLHGSLGAASPQVWQEVRRAVPTGFLLSAALGEIVEDNFTKMAKCAQQLAGYQFAKVGLAGCRRLADWETRWRALLRALPAGTAPVAVLYADWKTAGAPSPRQMLRAAQAAGCAALLIDTYSKDGGSLTAHLAPPELAEILDAARELGIQTVLAGSLTLELARELLPLAPDFVAVRGAVCRGGRTGVVDETLVAVFAKMSLSSPRATISLPAAQESSATA